jgi:hypothetical protein
MEPSGKPATDDDAGPAPSGSEPEVVVGG